MRETDDDFSFKQLFLPLTTKKAIYIICILGIVVFFNALFNGFVWDDKAYILNNLDIHSFSLTKIIGSSYFNKDGYYRPFPALYFSLLYIFFKNQAFFYHFSQVCMHIINAILVFRLFTYFFRKETSLLFALLFLVHPVVVESVAFIGASISPLFVFFGLCALLLLLSKNQPSPLRFTGILFFLFLSLLTKEGGVLFFILVLLYTYVLQKKSFTKLFLYESLLVPLYLFLRIVVGKVYLTQFEATLFGHGSTAADGRFVPIMELSLIQRILMIPSIIWYYIKTVFYPAKLAVDQTWIITTYTLNTFYLPLLCSVIFFLLLLSFAWYLYRIKSALFKAYIFFFIWFVIGIGMHLQFLPLDMTVADRWFYFPFIGLLGMLIVLTEQFLVSDKTKNIALTLTLTLLILLSVRTMIRNANFADEISLYTHDRLIEDNYEIELNLGSAFGVIGELDQTLIHYKQSVALYPNEANYDNLGLFSEWKGNFKEARIYYQKALSARSFYLNPTKRLSFTYTKLCSIHLRLHEPDKARTICLEGIKQYPQDHDLWLQLAESEYLLGHQKEALESIKKALTISSDKKSEQLYDLIKSKKPLELK